MFEDSGMPVFGGYGECLFAARGGQCGECHGAALARREANACAQTEDRIEHASYGIAQCARARHRDWRAMTLSATEKECAIGLVFQMHGKGICGRYHMRRVDLDIVRGTRSALCQQCVGLCVEFS